MKTKCEKLKIAGILCGGVAAVLMIVGFFSPPLAIIDNSVLIAAGEFFTFAGLYMAWDSITLGISAKISHRDTTIELNKENKQKQVLTNDLNEDE